MGNIVEVTDLVKRFGDFTAVDGVSFSIAEGEVRRSCCLRSQRSRSSSAHDS